MPPLTIPNTVRANLIWTLSGQEYAVNSLHYLVPSGQAIGAAEATDFASEVGIAMVAANLDDRLSNTVSFSRATVRDLRSANLPEFSASDTQGGLDNSAVLPLMTSMCVTLRTAFAGKSYRGRTYLTGFSETYNIAGGIADASVLTSAQQFMENMMTLTIDGETWTLGVMSPTLEETNAVTSVECRDNIWDTQRRRSYPGI